MPQFRPGELSQWVSRMWSNGVPDGPVCGITQDTRNLKPGDLYVAIRGERLDGHRFIEEAFGRGAVGALVQDGFDGTDKPVLKVPDTIKGLQDLARGYRKTWTSMPIGITGSVGKTTVKEMCADILSEDGETHRTAGNYNNHIGLPLTMLSMPSSCRFGVFEIGMNRPGEIGELAGILQPKIAMLSDICNAHRENFSSLEAIAREKAKLVARVPSAGTVLLDRDSEWYGLVRSGVCARVVTLSYGGDGDYAGHPVSDRVMSVNGSEYTMPLPGEHIMRNALRAIALGLELGLTAEQVEHGLRCFKSAPMRWQEIEINGIHFINDAYNANPLSMRAGLGTFASLPGDGARWAVLGGMRELGDTETEEHADLGRFVDTLHLDGVVAVGRLAGMISCSGVERFFQCADAAEAAGVLKENLRAGDHALLKASRGEKLEQILDLFREK